MGSLVGWKPKSNDRNVASVRFRCLTPLAELQRVGFAAEVYSDERAAAGDYSAVVFSKLYGASDQELAAALARRGVRTILDVSDNHFYNPHDLPEYRRAASDLRGMIGSVDRVFCCSPHLAHIIQREAAPANPPVVVGDAVEPMRLAPDASDPFDLANGEPFRIVWFGSHGSPNAPSGMEDVLRILGLLEEAHRQRPCELVIVSNNRGKFDALAPRLPLPSRYVEWSDTALMQAFGRANLVVVPVTPNPFTKCKSNNRVATALWHGIPVIADRIPAYEELDEFCILDDWRAGFSQALAFGRDLQLRTAAGSAYVRNNFGVRQIGAAWRRAIKAVLSQPAGRRAA